MRQFILVLTAASATAFAPARLRCPPPRMGFFDDLFKDGLPGFSQMPIPDGYARASHILFLGADEATEKKADFVLDRIRSGMTTFPKAAREYSSCPTRDQEPAGDLGTFASLSAMSNVDEMRTFEGRMELPYEGQNTRAFDDAIFAAPIGEVQKVTSFWGVHLILVTERGAGDRAVIAPDKAVSFDAEAAIKETAAQSDAGKSL